jgi:nonsense-mediated mRNA decay protein 3
VTFVVNLMQCPDCCEAATPREHWIANVQIRQDTTHKRTLFWLEQQILSHRAHLSSTTIERRHGGVDFHFTDKASGQRFVNFVKSRLPVHVEESAKQMGEDIQCGTLDMRFSFAVRVPPLNRQDLIILPPRFVKGSGNQSFIAVVHKVVKKIKLIDPVTAKMIDVDGPTYWDRPFTPILSLDSLRRFVVISIDPIGPKCGRFQIADVELTDEETYSDRILVRTHLGAHLHESEPCLGYDVRVNVLPDDIQDLFKKQDLPEVIIVGRTQPLAHKRQRKRPWHVKQLAPRPEHEQEEFEEFLDDLENDAELRKEVEIFKNEGVEVSNPELQSSLIAISEMKIDDGQTPFAYDYAPL